MKTQLQVNCTGFTLLYVYEHSNRVPLDSIAENLTLLDACHS